MRNCYKNVDNNDQMMIPNGAVIRSRENNHRVRMLYSIHIFLLSKEAKESFPLGCTSLFPCEMKGEMPHEIIGERSVLLHFASIQCRHT